MIVLASLPRYARLLCVHQGDPTSQNASAERYWGDHLEEVEGEAVKEVRRRRKERLRKMIMKMKMWTKRMRRRRRRRSISTNARIRIIIQTKCQKQIQN